MRACLKIVPLRRLVSAACLITALLHGAATAATTADTPACSAVPVTSSSGFSRVETPVAWNYRATEPSTKGCKGGKTYEVGPGKTYENPRNVPWLDLQPCDQVLIHWRPEPYRDILYIGVRGEPDRFISIKGVPGPRGERPVFDGNGAVAPTDVGAPRVFDAAGMIVIAKPESSSRTYRYKPGYLLIQGLKIQNVRAPSMVTGLNGKRAPWNDFVAGILINPAEHVALIDNEIADNSLGLFTNSLDDEPGQTRDILIRGNYFHGNGEGGGKAGQHNAYTENIGTIYEYNYFGPPLKGSSADNIKDRSAGIVFRYNYVEQGVDLLALRDPQSNRLFEAAAKDCLGERLSSSAFVYGNTFVATEMTVWDEWPIFIAHGDGDYGHGEVRDGHLYFYNNRVISRLDMAENTGLGVPLFHIQNKQTPTTVVARNNVFYATKATPQGKAAPFALFYWQGNGDFQSNWINQYVKVMARKEDGGMSSGTRWNGAGIESLKASGDDPGFVDVARGDFNVREGSPFFKLDAPMPEAVIKRGLQPTGKGVMRPFEAVIR